MAAGNLPEPGTKWGPCMDACAHLDCAETRTMAKTACAICGDPIGYDSPFYQRNSLATDMVEEGPRVLVHASCAEDEIERQRKEQGAK